MGDALTAPRWISAGFTESGTLRSKQTLSRRALLLALLAGTGAHALGRVPYGGVLRAAVPWGLSKLDPHAADDPLATFFADALFDSLYAIDDAGRVYPSLADGPPTSVSNGVAVRLRSGVVSGTDRALGAADLEFSLQRALLHGAYPLLHAFGAPKRDKNNASLVVFPKGNPDDLARALASPLCAVVPRSFSPVAPEGTGAFHARFTAGRINLTRNLEAARGAAFLERVEISGALDLADALRRFETEELDLGWLGRGLHRPRPKSQLFESRDLGWIVLHTGKQAARRGTPGTAQRLLNAIAPERLARFGLQHAPRAAGAERYAGPSCELLFRDDSPYLAELGQTLAELLSSPGHEIRTRRVDLNTLATLKQNRDYCFLLNVVRTLGPAPRERQLALLAASDRALSKNPPRLPPGLSDRDLELSVTRSLTLGIVGQLRVVAASLPEFRELERWDLRRVWRAV